MDTLGCGDTQAALGFFVDPAVPVVLVGTVAIRYNDQNCAQGIRSGDPNMLLLFEYTSKMLDRVAKLYGIRVAKKKKDTNNEAYIWISEGDPDMIQD